MPNGLEMSRPGSQGQYRAELNTWLAGSAPSSCWAARRFRAIHEKTRQILGCEGRARNPKARTDGSWQ